MRHKIFSKNQKGISVYLATIIIAILLSSALGLNTIYMGQAKTIKEMGNSVVAFYAANVGVEQVLLDRANPQNIAETALSNGATYQVAVSLGVSCGAVNYCIKSIGKYGKTSRAIQITY